MADSSTPAIKDLTFWLSDLNNVPQEWKTSKLWMAQNIFFSKQNDQPLLNKEKAEKYRELDKMGVNEKELKKMVDPPTAQSPGGDPKYFSADWKANPFYIHLMNSVKAKLEKDKGDRLTVSIIDKVAKLEKQKDKEKIIYQHLVRKIINHTLQELGLPEISDAQDPYKYIQKMQAQAKEGGKESENNGSKDIVDSIDNNIDYIRSEIRDNESLALYEENVYKGDIEKVFELGITHYLINMNKFPLKKELFDNDLLHFNSYVGECYTDKTTGRQNVRYHKPEEIKTSPFTEKNGEDIERVNYEMQITFSEFVRRFGANLNDEQLKEVFELNKTDGAKHNMNYSKAGGVKGGNAGINIGYLCCMTQDAEAFSEKLVAGKIKSWQPQKLSWIPDEKKNEGEVKREKHYNTWYSCYYIPPPGSRMSKNQFADWAWQAQYIFDMDRVVDMYRYGVDLRYAKSPFVIWRDRRASFTDIVMSYKDKMDFLWQKFQNYIVQDFSATVFDWDFIYGMLNAVDEETAKNEGNNEEGKPSGGNGAAIVVEQMKMIRQAGTGFLKLRDKNGNVVANARDLIQQVDSGQMAKAENTLKVMTDLYSQIIMNLSYNDVTDGAGKPRQNQQSVFASVSATENGLWYIERASRECDIMFGERTIQYILNMVREHNQAGFKDRFKEFQSVIGLSNALLVEGIEDIPPEMIGITVDLENVTAAREYIFNLANKMADNNEVSRDLVGLIVEMSKTNYKYAYVMLMVGAKKKQREKEQQAELAHQRQLELGQQQLQMKQAEIGAKSQGKQQEIAVEKQFEEKIQMQIAQMKADTQAQLKEIIKNNKITQDEHKSALDGRKEDQKQQQAFGV